jgi:hypothetical protein
MDRFTYLTDPLASSVDHHRPLIRQKIYHA